MYIYVYIAFTLLNYVQEGKKGAKDGRKEGRKLRVWTIMSVFPDFANERSALDWMDGWVGGPCIIIINQYCTKVCKIGVVL